MLNVTFKSGHGSRTEPKYIMIAVPILNVYFVQKHDMQSTSSPAKFVPLLSIKGEATSYEKSFPYCMMWVIKTFEALPLQW